LECPKEKQRVQWAITKSRQLAHLQTQIELGIEPTIKTDLTTAVSDYHKRSENRLRSSTIELYKQATDKFLQWANNIDIKNTNQLTAQKLTLFKDYLLSTPKLGYFGTTIPNQRCSPATVNWQLRAIKTMLTDWRIRGIINLTSDTITTHLKAIPQNIEIPEFLTIPEIKQLLQACETHDDAMFLDRQSNIQQRYKPITPFVRFCLLTGVRRGEALSLTWDCVDLTGTGTIRIKAEKTKTARGRVIPLDVSPSLHRMLSQLPRTSESVFNLSLTEIEAARRRLTGSLPEHTPKGNKRTRTPLQHDYGAPKRFCWQLLRATCATFLCNAPGIFGSASAWASAKRLGHSVAVAERHYAGLLSVNPTAKTIEQAMGI
jgi:integrase